jgi:hypothetical protein
MKTTIFWQYYLRLLHLDITTEAQPNKEPLAR